MTVRLIAFSGSLRSNSLNHRLVEAAAGAARDAGAEVEVLRLRDFEIPLYDGDLEESEGVPAGAARFKAQLAASDGFLIASPEYNGFMSGALKNAIDWATRPEAKDEPPLSAFRGKTAALMAASPGALGGIRGLPHLRTLLAGIGVLVLADARGIGGAHEAFGEDGALVRDRDRGGIESLARQLVDTCSRLKQD